jgi:hypothetical protein
LFCEQEGYSGKPSETLKIQNEQFEKRRFRDSISPSSGQNLTADRICLTDLLYCAIGVQQQANNFVCTSLFLSAFTMDEAKLLEHIFKNVHY